MRDYNTQMIARTTDSVNGDGMIWDSSVKVEIGPTTDLTHSLTSDPSLPKPVDVNTNHLTMTTYSPTYPLLQRNIRSSLSVAGDAGDGKPQHVIASSSGQEVGLCTDIRGRPRTRSKQLRRRGIDLSRDELRISLRWSDGERQSMEEFRQRIRKKAMADNASQPSSIRWHIKNARPFVKEAKTIKSRLARSLRNNVSRGRASPVQQYYIYNNAMRRPHPQLQPVHQAQRYPDKVQPPEEGGEVTIYQSDSSNSAQTDSQLCRSDSETHVQHLNKSSRSLPSPRMTSAQPTPSWQQHLNNDLQQAPRQRLHRKRGRYILQEDTPVRSLGNGDSRQRTNMSHSLFSHYEPVVRNNSTAQPLPASSTADTSRDDIGGYWRLPSLADSNRQQPSSASQASSLSPPRLETLDKIIYSRESESVWWRSSSLDLNTSEPLLATETVPRNDQDNIDSLGTAKSQAPSADLISALKHQLARPPFQLDCNAVQPLLLPSHTRHSSNTKSKSNIDFKVSKLKSLSDLNCEHLDAYASRSRATSRRFPSSISFPNMSDLDSMSRFSSFHTDLDPSGEVGEANGVRKDCWGGGDSIVDDMKRLALHSLATRLPLEYT